jgi:hypothetical protein
MDIRDMSKTLYRPALGMKLSRTYQELGSGFLAQRSSVFRTLQDQADQKSLILLLGGAF